MLDDAVNLAWRRDTNDTRTLRDVLVNFTASTEVWQVCPESG